MKSFSRTRRVTSAVAVGLLVGVGLVGPSPMDSYATVEPNEVTQSAILEDGDQGEVSQEGTAVPSPSLPAPDGEQQEAEQTPSGEPTGEDSNEGSAQESDQGEPTDTETAVTDTQETGGAQALSTEVSSEEPDAQPLPGAFGAPVPFGAGNAMCKPGQLLAVTEHGYVVIGDENAQGGLGTKYDDPAWWTIYDDWTPPKPNANAPTKYGVNGIAMEDDGTLWAFGRYYQYDKNYPKTRWNTRVRMMVKRPGEAWKFEDFGEEPEQKTYAFSHKDNMDPIAGGINPLNGRYAWGGFQELSEARYFKLSEIDLTTGERTWVGRIPVGSSAKNGDIAYDSEGNLYIVDHGGTGTSSRLSVTTVTKEALEQGRIANAGKTGYDPDLTTVPGTTATASQSAQYDGDQVNGIAVGSDGRLYVSTTQRVLRVDPATAIVTVSPVFTNPYTNDSSSPFQDLTSCGVNSPTTLLVQKDLDGTVDQFDPFTLEILDESTPITSVDAETRVPGSTILKENTGRVWVDTDTPLQVRELSDELSQYDSTLECRIDGVSGPAGQIQIANDTGTSGTITLPEAAQGKNTTCTFTNTLKPPPPLCEPGELFAVIEYGQVVKGNETDVNVDGIKYDDPAWQTIYETWDPPATSSPNSAPAKNRRKAVNGLAMADDGTMWAYARFNDEGVDNFDVGFRMMVKRPGQTWAWEDFGSAGQMTYAGNGGDSAYGGSPDYPIAGGIDPNTGSFVMAWPSTDHNTNKTYIIVSEIDIDSNSPTYGERSFLGKIQIPEAGANGDLAFDNAGNMYLVTQEGNSLSITSVTSGALDTGRQSNTGMTDPTAWPTTIPATQATASEEAKYDGQVNGIAVGSDGGLYISTTERVVKVDPVTAKIIKAGPQGTQETVFKTPYANGRITDLTSCKFNDPTTLLVQKDLDASVDVNAAGFEPFELQVVHDSTPIISADAKTRVSGSTILEETTGQVWVEVGQELTVQELSPQLGDYDSSLECRIDGSANPLTITASSDGTSGKITLPEAARGKNTTCTFTNTPIPTQSLTLIKELDHQYGGTADVNDFDLTATPDQGSALEFDSGETKEVDAGDYTLSETLLPGYEQESISCEVRAAGSSDPYTPHDTTPADQDEVSVTVDAGEEVRCTITNKDLPGSVIWEKHDEQGNKLAGAEWFLTGPGIDPATHPDGIRVTDCTDSSCVVIGNYEDSDETAGIIELKELPWGEYTLTEAKAPSGYELNAATFEFTIDGTKLEIELDPIVNKPRPSPTLPLTGGLSSFMFTATGAGLLVLALLASNRWRRRTN